MNGIIYKATCKTTGWCYIGQTTKSIEERAKNHWYSRKDGTKFHNALLEYGRKDFTWEILETCDERELNNREAYWISYYNSFENGYNDDTGGGYSKAQRHPSKRTRNKISNKAKEMWSNDEKREQIGTSIKLTLQTDDSKEIKSQVSKELWNNSEYRKKSTEKLLLQKDNEYRKEQHKKGCEKYWSKEKREEKSNSLKGNQYAKGSKSVKGKIWITNGTKNTMVFPKDAEEYYNAGWYKGITTKKKVVI